MHEGRRILEAFELHDGGLVLDHADGEEGSVLAATIWLYISFGLAFWPLAKLT